MTCRIYPAFSAIRGVAVHVVSSNDTAPHAPIRESISQEERRDLEWREERQTSLGSRSDHLTKHTDVSVQPRAMKGVVSPDDVSPIPHESGLEVMINLE